MTNYATKNDLIRCYGLINIQKWTDLDNDRNPNTIEDRIEWALENATELVNSRLMNDHYEVPFSTPPKLIVLITALQAGVLLYDSRQIVSASGKDPLSRQRMDIARYFRQITSGQLKLLDASSGEALDTLALQAPSVSVDDDEIADTENAVEV